MTLDDAMLKRLAGGSGVTVGGRRTGQGSHYSFVWQAGFVLVFNNGDMPKFDSADIAFIGRMFVVPMRSKFVDFVPTDGAVPLREPHTFPKDVDIEQRFSSWLPAVMDVLLDHFPDADQVFASLPPSMSDWRRQVTSANNPLTRWCEEVLEVTGNADDCVVLGDVMNLYRGTPQPKSKDEFSRLVKACFDGVHGVTFVNKTVLRGTRDSKRAVLRGVKLRYADADADAQMASEGKMRADEGKMRAELHSDVILG